MKRKEILWLVIGVVLTAFFCRSIYYAVSNLTYTPQEGDVIFHVSKSSQSTAIKIGTLSRYSHCGMIVEENNKLYVLEAENGLEMTPIRQWLKRGRMGDHYRVMRLKDKQTLHIDHTTGGRYDSAFLFNNGRYYCSELVWEQYKKNNILLCQTKQLKDYHFLYLPMVQKQIQRRGFDMNQEVVAPSELIKSRYLRTVLYGYGKPIWL